MKVYLLFCFFATVTTLPVESNSLEYQNGPNLHMSYNDLANIAREGNTNVNRYSSRERNSNLLASSNENPVQNNLRTDNSNNLKLLNSENNKYLRYYLLNIGREGNSNNMYRTNSDYSDLSPIDLDNIVGQNTPNSLDSEVADVQSNETETLYSKDVIDTIIEKYLENQRIERDSTPKPLDVPRFESRFGYSGYYGGGGFGGGAGIGGGIGLGIGAGIGMGAGIGAFKGAGAYGYGYGHGYGGGGYGYPAPYGYPGYG